MVRDPPSCAGATITTTADAVASAAMPALVRGMRPHHWIKNLLVFAVPLAAGALTEPDVLVATGVAFVAFCAASSATYLVNDVLDAPRDRMHPRKRHRPVASGALSPRAAVIAAALLAIAALALALLASLALVGILATYLVLTMIYSRWLKAEPVIELALLASGFLLRAVAGGAATGLPISMWFLLVAGFGSLFIAAGKRYSELIGSDPEISTRAVLEGYTPTFLRFVWGMTGGITITAYGLWSADLSLTGGPSWEAASVIPFALLIMKYGLVIDEGEAEAPEEVLLRSRWLQSLGLAWLVLFTLGVIRA
jgi:decaprenyl-phosphate phosphoribosyltransferase